MTLENLAVRFGTSAADNDIMCNLIRSPVENQNDLELDFKVFFFVDSCC